ncbi:MAG TPA: hypothetical protein PKA63_10420 [Oligoflexia bacterium]|nr:hypothetical protein [Oligoflexia bacterium]HMP49071.1 hypothetical protein [Oligoflexia bacterium]
MSQSVSQYTEKDIQKIVEASPFPSGSLFKLSLYCLIIVAVLSFVHGIVTGGQALVNSWMALHVNFLFWFGLAAAASGFAAVFHICNAQWARPLRRVFESAFPFFVISPLFILVLYFGADNLFVWAREPVHGKEAWLSKGFLYGRDFFGVCLLVYVISRVVLGSLRMDITAIRKGFVKMPDGAIPERWKAKGYECLESKNDSAEEGIQETYSMMGRMSPVCVMIYALSMSLIAFDLLMSADPHWYSTMFGGFYFMSSVYSAVAFVSLSLVVLRSYHPIFRSAFKRKTLHDLGKLLFGFGIFWAYLFWSHYLPIWYSNMPEETGYMILRLREYPWRNVAWLVLGLCFIIPFFLGLSRDLKQVPVFLASTAVLVLVGLWLQYYLLFAPSIYTNEVSISVKDIAMALGFLSTFVLGVIYYLERVPLIPFADLLIDTRDKYLMELEKAVAAKSK